MTKCSPPVDPNSIVIPKKPANKSASEHRKITKPIMEKRRRARINHSLEQLKQILIENFHECSKKSSSLEKADILVGLLNTFSFLFLSSMMTYHVIIF